MQAYGSRWALASLVVPGYDEATAFFVGTLWDLLQPLPAQRALRDPST